MPFFLNATSATSGDASWTEGTLASSVLTTQGDVLYRDASGLQRLAAGTSGQVLQTQGAGANPQWADAGGSSLVLSRVGVANTTTDTTEAIFTGCTYAFASNSLAAADTLRWAFTAAMTAQGGSKDTVVFRVRLGGVAGTILWESPAATLGDTTGGNGWAGIMTTGASGTASYGGMGFLNLTGQTATATTSAQGILWRSDDTFALDTTASQSIVLTYDFGANDAGNVAVASQFSVWYENAP